VHGTLFNIARPASKPDHSETFTQGLQNENRHRPPKWNKGIPHQRLDVVLQPPKGAVAVKVNAGRAMLRLTRLAAAVLICSATTELESEKNRRRFAEPPR
jgi:hypothetical protein